MTRQIVSMFKNFCCYNADVSHLSDGKSKNKIAAIFFPHSHACFISLQNSLFVKDCFEKEIPNPFINYFQKPESHHFLRMRSAFKNCFCTKS